MEGPGETLVGGEGQGRARPQQVTQNLRWQGGGTERLGVLWGASFSFQELEPGPALGV